MAIEIPTFSAAGSYGGMVVVTNPQIFSKIWELLRIP